MQKTLTLLIGILFLLFPNRSEAQQVLNVGIPAISLSVVTTTGDGTTFALPSLALQCTWQSTFGTAPASLTLQLKTSNDNITFSTVDTSTSTTSESRTISTSARFILARLNALSGGSTVTVSINCFGIGNSGFGLSPTDDSLIVGNGTAWQVKTLTSCSAASSALTYNTTTNAFGCNSISGSGTPAAPSGSVQFNDFGSFGGFGSWDGSTLAITGISNAINFSGSATGVPAQLATSGSDLDVALWLAPKADVDGNFASSVYISQVDPSTWGTPLQNWRYANELMVASEANGLNPTFIATGSQSISLNFIQSGGTLTSPTVGTWRNGDPFYNLYGAALAPSGNYFAGGSIDLDHAGSVENMDGGWPARFLFRTVGITDTNLSTRLRIESDLGVFVDNVPFFVSNLACPMGQTAPLYVDDTGKIVKGMCS